MESSSGSTGTSGHGFRGVEPSKEKRKTSDELFLHSEDAFKELMKSSSSATKKSGKKGSASKLAEEVKNGGTGEDEFGLSNVKYDPMFK